MTRLPLTSPIKALSLTSLFMASVMATPLATQATQTMTLTRRHEKDSKDSLIGGIPEDLIVLLLGAAVFACVALTYIIVKSKASNRFTSRGRQLMTERETARQELRLRGGNPLPTLRTPRSTMLNSPSDSPSMSPTATPYGEMPYSDGADTPTKSPIGKSARMDYKFNKRGYSGSSWSRSSIAELSYKSYGPHASVPSTSIDAAGGSQESQPISEEAWKSRYVADGRQPQQSQDLRTSSRPAGPRKPAAGEGMPSQRSSTVFRGINIDRHADGHTPRLSQIITDPSRPAALYSTADALGNGQMAVSPQESRRGSAANLLEEDYLNVPYSQPSTSSGSSADPHSTASSSSSHSSSGLVSASSHPLQPRQVYQSFAPQSPMSYQGSAPSPSSQYAHYATAQTGGPSRAPSAGRHMQRPAMQYGNAPSYSSASGSASSSGGHGLYKPTSRDEERHDVAARYENLRPGSIHQHVNEHNTRGANRGMPIGSNVAPGANVI